MFKFGFLISVLFIATSCTNAVPKVSILFSLDNPRVEFTNSKEFSNSFFTASNSITVNVDLHEKTTDFAIGEGSDCSALNWQQPQKSYDINLSPGDGPKKISYRFKIIKKTFDCTTVTLYLDTTAPLAALSGVPTGTNNTATLNVDVLPTDGLVGYQYKVGPSASTNCTVATDYGDASGSATDVAETTNITNSLTAIPNGSITLCVIGKDAAGNIQNTASATTATWVKDTTAPAMTLNFAALTGAFANINNVASFQIFGSCSELGTAVQVSYSNGGASVALTTLPCTSDIVLGSIYSGGIDLSGISDGTYPLTVSQTDASGITGTATLNFTKDTAAPILAIAVPAVYAYVNSNSITNFAVSGTCSENTLAVSVGATDGVANVSGNTNCASNAWTLNLALSTLAEGPITLAVTHSDAAGNTTTVNRNITKDTTAPASPSFVSITPTSPDASTRPTIVGLTSADTASVSLYNSGLCTSLIGSGNKTIFEGSGIGANVGASVTTSIYARSFDSAGNDSACTLMADYTNNNLQQCTSIGLSGAVTQIALGHSHSCALEKGGTVKCWGYNYSGQLGDGTATPTPKSTPVAVAGLTGVTQLALGNYHSCALVNDGTVKCWGSNSYGVLGDGTTTSKSIPVAVQGLTGVTQIALGSDHTCALETGGTVKCWGYNYSGQLGDGTATPTPKSTPVAVAGLTGVTQLALGYTHTCAIQSDGTVKCWGENSSGQLGDGTATSKSIPVAVQGLTGVTQIALGSYHTCALETGGTVKCWGYNYSGQLGDGTATSSTTPVAVPRLTGVLQIAVGSTHTCALENGGTVKCWGYGSSTMPGSNTPVTIQGLNGITQIELGSYHSCAVENGGTVKCWGSNYYGQLGDGTRASLPPPPIAVTDLNGATQIALGLNHSCALENGGTVKCWGSNWYGQLGDGTTTDKSTHVAVQGMTGVKQIALGLYHTCALENGGTVKCWGYNYHGQLGDGTTTDKSTPVAVQGMTGVKQIALGLYHTCALENGGTVKCWGNNSYGQLGDGTATSRTTPFACQGMTGVTQIGLGDNHTCAVETGGTVKCWGNNSYGQLGDGTATSRTAPVAVQGMTSVTQIELGRDHTCALENGGTVKCWGNNSYGKLGYWTTTSTSSTTPLAVQVLTGVTQIDLGRDHTCALENGGTVKCWGYNNHGQLGAGSATSSTTPVSLPGLTGVTQIALGGAHTCAIQSDGTVKCWGDNSSGQLGSVSPSVDVLQSIIGPAAKLTLNLNIGSYNLNNTLFSGPNPAVQIRDACNNLITAATNEITLSASSTSDCNTAAAGTLRTSALNNTVSASGGIALFSSLKYFLANLFSSEDIYISATSPGLAGACSASSTQVQRAKPLITLAGTSTDNNGTGSNRLTLNLPSGTNAGDFLLATVTSIGSATAPQNGWNILSVQTLGPSTVTQTIFYKITQAGEPSAYDFDFSTNEPASGGIVRFAGVNGTSPFTVNIHIGGTSTTTSVTAPGITFSSVEQAPELLYVYSKFSTSETIADPTDLELIFDSVSSAAASASTATTRTLVYRKRSLSKLFPTFTTDSTLISTNPGPTIFTQIPLRQAPAP